MLKMRFTGWARPGTASGIFSTPQLDPYLDLH